MYILIYSYVIEPQSLINRIIWYSNIYNMMEEVIGIPHGNNTAGKIYIS